MTPDRVSSRFITARRRMRVRWWAIKRRWYSSVYRLPASMLPKTGKGEFVTVRRRGPYVDMHDERTGSTIRIYPYQPNHGVEVEEFRDGRMLWRTHCDIDTFRRMGFGEREHRV